ncbi:hypothetical protein LJC59_06885 [Desulfovibrio sp. OttesenSCG-928-A18]|nr:hypothetical protein [Desulfovibrio sp. OttesenSCG-928-A18]
MNATFVSWIWAPARCLALLLALFLVPGQAGAAVSIDGTLFTPFFVGHWDGKAADLDLMAGFSDRDWLDIEGAEIFTDSPYTEGECPQGEGHAISPLVDGGEKLLIYSAEGKKLASAVIEQKLDFRCMEASGQKFLHAALRDLAPEPGAEEYSGTAVALLAEVTPAFYPTKRVQGQDGAFVLQAEIPGSGTAAVHYTKNDEGFGRVFRQGTVEILMYPALTEDPEETTGYFMDLDRNGILEFLSLTDGPAGSINLYSFMRLPLKPLYSIDTGE